MRFWIRNGIYLSALGLLLPWLVLRSLRTGRYRQGLRQKLLGIRAEDFSGCSAGSPASDRASQTVWFHGVSVGEIQLLIPLIELVRQSASIRVVVTTTTESGMELARRQMSGVELYFFPCDFSWAVRRTLDSLQPDLIVFAELELWPNLIDCATDRQIPMVVINGRLSERSSRRYQRFGRLTKDMFSKLTHVAAQSADIAARFVQCGSSEANVSVTGSLKFDNVGTDRESAEVSQLRELCGLRPEHRVIVVGSTQSPEEMAAFEAFSAVRDQFPRARLIVVPRHPDRFDTVYASLAQQTDAVLRRSSLTHPVAADDWQVLLVDSVGELKWWWGLAEIAVVGGSFGERGGQNMLEPAGYACNVAFGPNTENFREIASSLLQAEAATRLASLSQLASWIRGELEDSSPGRKRGQHAKQLVLSQQGANERTLDRLLSYLNADSDLSALSAQKAVA